MAANPLQGAPELPAELKAALEELYRRIFNETAKRELWANRFTASDRSKFHGPPRDVLAGHNIIDLWRIARGTPTWNQCIVEIAHALGFINAARRNNLLNALGAIPANQSGRSAGAPAVPQWDHEARELRYRGKVVRVVNRPNQAGNIVAILRAFEAAGWPPRIDDPHKRKPSDETRRRDMSSLNKGLSLLKFACDGNGTGFLWKQLPRPRAKKKAAKRRRP